MKKASTKLWLLFAFLFIFVAGSLAYVLLGYQWPVGSVIPYYINANTAQVVCEMSNVKSAACYWNQIKPSGLRLSYAGPVSVTDSFLDGLNTVCWKDRGDISALATAYCWYWVGTGTLAETDIVFNDYHNWSTSGDDYDVKTVALHEFGHCVGLDHSSEGIMRPFYSGIQRTIDNDARAGFLAMYGGADICSLYLSSDIGGTTNPAPGIYSHDKGTSVMVRAVSDSGYIFSGWSGDASGWTNPIAITMDSDKSIKANFVKEVTKYTLTISSGSGGTANPVPGIYSHEKGTEVTIEALPDEGYRFCGWSGDASGNTNPITITMDSDKSIKANFIWQYTLTIESGTGGTTDLSPGTYIYDEGTKVTVTATPDDNYRFGGWSGDASGTDRIITITMDSDKSIKANFIRLYKLTINTSTGGTTSPSPGTHIYDEGTGVTIFCVSDTHWRFSHWSGDVSGTIEPITITMDSDKYVKANFIRIIYPPLNFSGKKVENRSLFLVEYISDLTWQANRDNVNIVKYRLYLLEGGSRNLLVELNANTFEYGHRRVQKDMRYTYILVAVNNEGREGDPASITIQ